MIDSFGSNIDILLRSGGAFIEAPPVVSVTFVGCIITGKAHIRLLNAGL
jgi:hypothetical protein